MARPASRHPTELELEILKIVWRDGVVTVRHVRDRLASWRELAYNSVLTIMTIMVRKGYLSREKADGSYVYRSRITQTNTVRGMFHDLVRRLCGGSAYAAMLNFLQNEPLDRSELDELRRILDHKRKEDGK